MRLLFLREQTVVNILMALRQEGMDACDDDAGSMITQHHVMRQLCIHNIVRERSAIDAKVYLIAHSIFAVSLQDEAQGRDNVT